MRKTVPIKLWQYVLIACICLSTAIYSWHTVGSQGFQIRYREELQETARTFSRKAQELFAKESIVVSTPRIEIWCLNNQITMIIPKPSERMLSKPTFDVRFLEENISKPIEGIAHVISTDSTCGTAMHMATIRPKSDFELEYKYVNLDRNNTVDVFYFIDKGIALEALENWNKQLLTLKDSAVSRSKYNSPKNTPESQGTVPVIPPSERADVKPSDPVAENISSN